LRTQTVDHLMRVGLNDNIDWYIVLQTFVNKKQATLKNMLQHLDKEFSEKVKNLDLDVADFDDDINLLELLDI